MCNRYVFATLKSWKKCLSTYTFVSPIPSIILYNENLTLVSICPFIWLPDATFSPLAYDHLLVNLIVTGSTESHQVSVIACNYNPHVDTRVYSGRRWPTCTRKTCLASNKFHIVQIIKTTKEGANMFIILTALLSFSCCAALFVLHLPLKQLCFFCLKRKKN